MTKNPLSNYDHESVTSADLVDEPANDFEIVSRTRPNGLGFGFFFEKVPADVDWTIIGYHHVGSVRVSSYLKPVTEEIYVLGGGARRLDSLKIGRRVTLQVRGEEPRVYPFDAETCLLGALLDLQRAVLKNIARGEMRLFETSASGGWR